MRPRTVCGPAEQGGGPAAQVGCWSVQVHGGVRRFQVQQAAGMRAQGDLGGMHHVHGTGRGERADAHRQARGGGAGRLPRDERHRARGADHRGQFGHPAAGAAHNLVRFQDGAGGGTDSQHLCRAGIQGSHPSLLAGEYIRPVTRGAGDQPRDQRLGQDVTFAGEPRDRAARLRESQCRLDLGGSGLIDQAGGVAPLGEPAHPGFEFGAPGVGGGHVEVADGAVPGGAVGVRRELGPGPDPGVVEVVIRPGRLVVRVQPGETPPAGTPARLIRLKQRHLRAGHGQPGRHRRAQHARADHHERRDLTEAMTPTVGGRHRAGKHRIPGASGGPAAGWGWRPRGSCSASAATCRWCRLRRQRAGGVGFGGNGGAASPPEVRADLAAVAATVGREVGGIECAFGCGLDCSMSVSVRNRCLTCVTSPRSARSGLRSGGRHRPGAWVDVRPGGGGFGSGVRDSGREGSVAGEKRHMYDKVVAVPRSLCFYGEDEPLPDPVLTAAREALNAHDDQGSASRSARRDCACTGMAGHSVAGHGDTIGRGKHEDTIVAIVSLGTPRALLLRPRSGRPAGPGGRGGSLRFEVGHGDLLVMGGSCQRTWEHAVPKTSQAVGRRISVQFRPRGVR